MPDRARWRLVRRLIAGFGAGIVGGWVAGLLRKPPAPAGTQAADPANVPAGQGTS